MELVIIFVILSVLGAKGEKGFLFNTPRSLELDSVNTFFLHLFHIDAPGNIKIETYREYNGTQMLFAAEEFEIEKGTEVKELELFVPKLPDTHYGKITLSGTFENDYKINGEEKISYYQPKDKIIFIQTDKPLYKPGQEVKFRILLVNNNLKPLGGNVEGDIWIEDPKSSRMAQWREVPLGNGIKQLHFSLAEEPNLGMWTIYVKVGENNYQMQFEVNEYVLPKFEVSITTPPYVLVNAKIIPIKVCAKYTYGKPVVGMLKMNISQEYYSWSSDKLPKLEIQEKLNGCYEYELNTSSVIEYSLSYRRIEVFASVIEDGTGETQNETEFISGENYPLKLRFNRDTNFKAGLPYTGKLEVQHPDDTPALNEPIEICAIINRERILSGWWASKKIKICRNYTSDEEGGVNFIIPPQSIDSNDMQIRAKALKYEKESDSSYGTTLSKPEAWKNLHPWFSPSDSYIQIVRESEILPCDEVNTFKILFTSREEQGIYTFHYQIRVRGKAIFRGSTSKAFSKEKDISDKYKEDINKISTMMVSPSEDDLEEDEMPSEKETIKFPLVYEATIEIPIKPEMSPSFRLLVYYVREDTEIVSDSQIFTVNECFKNKVDFEFGDEVKQPGTRTSLKIKSSPNSLCGIRVVDKSVSLMDSRNGLTREKIVEFLQNTDSGVYYSKDHCREEHPGLHQENKTHKLQGTQLPPRAWLSSPYADALTAFDVFGYTVISDLKLLTRPCKMEKSSPFSSDNGYAPLRGTSMARPIPTPVRHPVLSPPPPSPPSESSIRNTKSAVEVRNYFPETWLFKLQMADSSGKIETKEVLPHTITEWIGNAFCMHEEDGLGMSEETGIKGFQEFFVSLTLPYSVIRGEKLNIPAKVFNYLEDENLPVSLSLEEASGFIVTGSSTMDMCLGGSKSDAFPIELKATELGIVNLTLRAGTKEGVCGDQEASSRVARDAVTRTVIVEPEGFPNEDVTSTIFCPTDEENGIFEKKLQFPLPEDLVSDSARAYIQITGDIMGPSFDNLDALVVLPTGCGEQNMVKFTPNVLVLNYLTAIGKLEEKLKNRAIDNLNKGAQRQMNYRHFDGSYSAFGTTDKEGSMILTAFVLRSFAEASKYITIDQDKFNETLQWVMSHQLLDGCFPEVGRTVGSQLKEGIGNQKGMITAYVLSSLLKAGLKNKTIIDSALTCMEKDNENMTPYKASLYAYTSALAENSDSVNKYTKILEKKAIETVDGTSFKNVNGSLSLDIQTAAYAVLTIMKSQDDIKEALPIVRWMSKHRNPRGGFISTQDTVLGLEALGEFAERLNKYPVNLSVVTSEDLNLKIDIFEEDKLLVREYKIPNIPSDINFRAEGSGCGLLQTVFRYNTVSPPQKSSFVLQTATECSDSTCKDGKIHICTRYIPTGKISNMVLVEVKMLSGMVPIKESIEKLYKDKDLVLMRYEIENNNVVFYFYELTNDDKCFEFDVEEVVHVEDRQPAIAKVYDYYATENSASVSYKLGE